MRPGNAEWQRDVALSYGRVAVIEALQGARDGALRTFRQGRNIIARLIWYFADRTWRARMPEETPSASINRELALANTLKLAPPRLSVAPSA